MSGERTPRSSSPGSRVPRGASVVLGFFRVCFFLGFWVRMTRAQQSSTQSDTRGLLCYVCEPKNVADVISEPTVRMQFPKFEDIQDCAHFNSSDYYIKECPRDFSSACYKASVDGNDWRMCGSQELEHPRGKCHKVRDILLCACQNELCNSSNMAQPSLTLLLFILLSIFCI